MKRILAIFIGYLLIMSCAPDNKIQLFESSGLPVPTVTPTRAAPQAAPVVPITPSPSITSDPNNKNQSARVTRVIDGDTLIIDNGQRVRLIGVDAPDWGECGHDEATAFLQIFVMRHSVILVTTVGRTIDHHGRYLRYIEVNKIDAGLLLIERGLAVAKYDSRDGYGRHLRQFTYITTDIRTPDYLCKDNQINSSRLPFKNCDEAREAGIELPMREGASGWNPKLDRDKDHWGCDAG